MAEPQSPSVVERKPPGSVASLVNRLSKELGQAKAGSPEVAVRKGANEIKSRRVKALYSYSPEHEDELRLEVNDVIEILGEEEEGWWKGKLNGKVGLFPSNFVKLLEGADEDKAKLEAPAKAGEAAEGHGEIQPKKVQGVGFGNIFAEQKIELRNTKGGGKPAAPPPSEAKKPVDGAGKPKEESKDGKTKFARALFSYEAENDDELSLNVGDVITILSTKCEDPGWWLGELNGKSGVFPDNFVSIITGEENLGLKKGAVLSPPAVPAKPKPPPVAAAASAQRSATPEPPKPTHPDTETKSASLKAIVGGGVGAGVAGELAKKKSEEKTDNKDEKGAEKSSILRKPPFALPSLTKPKAVDAKLPPDENSKGEELDHVTPLEVEKLSHPTASRPKNPNRRPPSQVFLKELGKDSSPSSEEAPSGPAKVPKSPTDSADAKAAEKHDEAKAEAMIPLVPREALDKVQAELEAFKRDTLDRIRQLEAQLQKLSSANSVQKL